MTIHRRATPVLPGSATMPPLAKDEMFDTRTRGWRGNMPQGLSHLALICAAKALGKGA
ncbi:hypothetical protein [Duffyella gerundensis]|uniref:hypothetical protein n=1 Tax=Duffyella TaxID=3026546 RepID=UPI003F6DC102